MKREAINHTKMRRLARNLSVEIYSARGIMESLWSATRDEAPAGNIGKLSDEDIADFIGWRGEPAALTDALVRAGWLDTNPTYRLVVHDWPDHCEDYVHAKLAKAGLRFASGSIPQVSKLNQAQRKSVPAEFAMPPALEPIKPVESALPLVAAIGGNSADGDRIVAAPARDASALVLVPYQALPYQSNPIHTQPKRLVVPMSGRFEEFWALHPGKKLRKEMAMGVWAHEVTTENEDSVFACLTRYVESQEVSNRAYMNPERWLSECAAGKFEATWPKARESPTPEEQGFTNYIRT